MKTILNKIFQFFNKKRSFSFYPKSPIDGKNRYSIEINDEGNLICPICGNSSWFEGPGGGSFGNIKCAKCESKFNNLGPFGLNLIDKK